VKYVYGFIQAPATNVMQWLGVRDTGQAQAVLQQTGVFLEASNGLLRFRHTWLQVNVPGKSTTWTLDPSWKYRDLHSSIDDPSVLPVFSLADYLHDTATESRRARQLPYEWYEDELTAFINSRSDLKGKTSLADLPYDGPIIAKNFLTDAVVASGFLDAPVQTEYTI